MNMNTQYEVSNCNQCGFLFADNIPAQDFYDEFYEKNIKYTYDIHEYDLPQGLINIHMHSYQLLDDHLKKMIPLSKDSVKILDIGCSTGYLLHLFKSDGYKNVLGVEASKACSYIGRELYGVEIVSNPLSELALSDQFDLIILSGVLEHISDINEAMKSILPLLSRNGLIYIVVPDASDFSSNPIEPFHEFSFEHINFFTGISLQNFMGKYGLKMEFFDSTYTNFYDTNYIRSIFHLDSTKYVVKKDDLGIRRLKDYIEKSQKKLLKVAKIINDLVKSQEKIYVWGCGSLTQRLLASTDLAKANISAFIDSNKKLHGQKIVGYKIIAPENIVDNKSAVFISSYVYGMEIKGILEKEFKFRGKIITLDN